MHSARYAFVACVEYSTGTLCMTSSSAALMTWTSSGSNFVMVRLPSTVIGSERASLCASKAFAVARVVLSQWEGRKLTETRRPSRSKTVRLALTLWEALDLTSASTITAIAFARLTTGLRSLEKPCKWRPEAWLGERKDAGCRSPERGRRNKAGTGIVHKYGDSDEVWPQS